MNKKRVLIIAESIAPVQAIAAIRWTKFAKYLSTREDFEITILTNQKDFSGKKPNLKQYRLDSTTTEDLNNVEIVYIPLSIVQGISNRLFNAISSRLAVLRDSKEASTTTSGLQVRFLSLMLVCADWITGKTMDLIPIKMRTRLAQTDCVISTFGPRWPHAVARRIKKENPKIPWIADFRDPSVSSAKNDNMITRSYADRITLLADCVMGISKGTVDNLFLKHGQRTIVITNGFDVDDMSSSCGTVSKKFSLVYTGTLYADDTCLRDIRPLFSVLDELLREGHIKQDEIEMVYAGTTTDLFLAAASEYPLVPSKSLGIVPRAEALSMQNSSAALVVCTWNTEYQKGVLTGKIFEYMRARKPVIGLCSGDISGSDLKELIEECQIGVCYEEADPKSYAKLKNAVLLLYEAWKRCGDTALPPESKELIMRYSYPALSAQLAGLVHQLCADSK